MVQRGLGVSLLPGSAVALEVEAGTLCRVDLRNVAPMRRQIVAMRRRDAGEPSGLVEAFLDMLRHIPSEI